MDVKVFYYNMVLPMKIEMFLQQTDIELRGEMGCNKKKISSCFGRRCGSLTVPEEIDICTRSSIVPYPALNKFLPMYDT